MRSGRPLFVEANLDPHYRPFRGIAFSILVHASLLTALIVIPTILVEDERPNLAEAIILDADDLENALYLPLLGQPKPPKAEASENKAQAEPTREGLSYPGPQPILSKFPVPTNHIQTILQPALKNPATLDNTLLPNIVRLPPPAVDRKLSVPDATAPQLQPPPLLAAQRDVNLAAPARPLAAPRVESRLYVPETLTSIARPATPVPAGQLDSALNGAAKPLAAPRADSRMAIPDATTAPTARPSTPVALALDHTASGPSKPLAAPIVESRFKLPDPVVPIARPALPVQVGETTIAFTAGPNRPLAAPRVDSRLSVPDAVSPQGQLNRTTVATPMEVPLNGPARPLAAPLAESRIKVSDSPVGPVARPSATPIAPRLDTTLTGPAKPLNAPVAESRIKVPEGTVSPAARPTAVPLPVDTAVVNGPPLVALSPTPARRDQTVVVPPGEARGQFAISPQPNLTFPGTEPGGLRGGSGNTTSVAGIVNSNSSTSAPTTRSGNNPNAGSAAGADAFPGITILGGETGTPTTIRSSSSTSTATVSIKSPPPPLQTSYTISILASGSSGGGLPDFGVFANEQVHTVYLDMRETVQDEPVTWTVAFGVRQPNATSADERVTSVGGRQEVVLPFPIDKARPEIPADAARKYSGRLVIAYAVVNAEGKMEQLAIKDSPDPALNELVLSALRKWTFRAARRNGEVIPAKMLLGIPVRTY
jgi:hypothetical protein